MTTVKYLKVSEIAKILPLSVRHLAERVTKRKDFPAPTRIGRTRFWKESVILAWLETRKEH